jgi:hypothetical protein
MILTGEDRRTRRITRPSATLSTTNPNWTDPGAKPGLSEHYFTWKLFSAVRETFSLVYSDEEVPNKTTLTTPTLDLWFTRLAFSVKLRLSGERR